MPLFTNLMPYIIYCPVTEKMVWVKMVRLDCFWSPKFGPAGPNLAAKNGPRANQKWSGLKNRETGFNRLKWKEGPVYKPS